MELIESKLLEPLDWKKPRRVFVNSMSDLFHENLPDIDILSVFQVMAKCPRHTFQVLTKRATNMRRVLSARRWRNLGYSPQMGGDHYVAVHLGEHRPDDSQCLPNVWLGVSVENQPTADERIPELLQTPAALRFVSYEPALAEVDWRKYLGLVRNQYEAEAAMGGILPRGPFLDWGIIGGESGPGARPFHLEWLRSTILQFKAADVPLFVKQFGAKPVQGGGNGCLWRLGRMATGVEGPPVS